MQNIYASVSGFAGVSGNGNSITKLNPQTAAIGPSVFVGSEPNKLVISDDASTIHVSLDGAAAIRKVDVPSMTAGLQFAWGTASQHPSDMAAMPGSPQSIATSD